MSVEDFPEVLPEQEEQQTEEIKVELQKPTEEVWEILKCILQRGFIKLRKNWFLENYQNRVMDVTTSPILIRQEFCEGKDRTYYFEIGEETASINLFDDYVQLWSEDHEYMGDYDWFYLAAAIQSMWNVVAIEEAQQKMRKNSRVRKCATSHNRKIQIANQNSQAVLQDRQVVRERTGEPQTRISCKAGENVQLAGIITRIA